MTETGFVSMTAKPQTFVYRLTADNGKTFMEKHAFNGWYMGPSADHFAFEYLQKPYIPASWQFGSYRILEKYNIVKVEMFDEESPVKAFTATIHPTMKPCRKRPVIVQAVQIHEPFFVDTMEGRMSGKPGDYLMMGVEGELYVCAQSVFEKTYDFISEKETPNGSPG
jgi:hypothetical protein